LTPIAFDTYNQTTTGDVALTLSSGGGDTPCGNAAIAFSCKDHGADAGAIAPTGHDGSHANAGGQVAVAFQPGFARNGRGAPDTVAAALTSEAGRTGKGDSAQCVATNWAVRRLTPRECERLQGFPDDYTLVPSRGKPAADGPRYKALGNSMAVNCMRWIGRRIEMVDGIA
jgi:DNA (cytosine-5)-methyltransferase 1